MIFQFLFELSQERKRSASPLPQTHNASGSKNLAAGEIFYELTLGRSVCQDRGSFLGAGRLPRRAGGNRRGGEAARMRGGGYNFEGKDIDERYWDSTRRQRKALQEFAKSEIEWAGILMKWYGRKKAVMHYDERRA